MTRIYTRHGDDGTTTLRGTRRISKADPLVELNGDIDEAQAALGLARAFVEPSSPASALLRNVGADLWIVMADVASPEGSSKGPTVSAEMISSLETAIDEAMVTVGPLRDFAVPGGTPVSAALDLARTVVRRAERSAVAAELRRPLVVGYLNRLSDLCWALARAEDRRAGRLDLSRTTVSEPS